jgi:hypothetical protein
MVPRVESNFERSGEQRITGELYGFAQGDKTTMNMRGPKV